MMYVNIIPKSGEFAVPNFPKLTFFNSRRFRRWSAQRLSAWDCGSAQTLVTAHRKLLHH